MKTFLKWMEEKNLLNEKTARSGFAWWQYPDLVTRSHYPDLWFAPRAADFVQKLGKHEPPHTQHVVLNQIPKGM